MCVRGVRVCEVCVRGHVEWQDVLQQTVLMCRHFHQSVRSLSER